MADTAVDNVNDPSPLSVRPKRLFDEPEMVVLCARKVEGQFYERKSKRPPEKLAETICAFANSNEGKGGLLAVGISDDGEVLGLQHRSDINIDRLVEYPVYAGAPSRHKFVNCQNSRGEEDKILLIHVPYLAGRVAETSKGHAFVRRGDKTMKLGYEERRELEYQKGQRSFEDEQTCDFNSDVLEPDVVNELLGALRKESMTQGATDEQLLLSLGLVSWRDDQLALTNAGLLILGRDPRSVLPGGHVRFVRYDGTKRKSGLEHNVVKDEQFAGPIPRLIQKVQDFLRSQFRDFTTLRADGKFKTEPEYPELAWHEVIVNALVHRSYSLPNMPVIIEMFDDRLEVTSPGGYPVGVFPPQFIHNPRNPRIMQALRYLGFVRMLSEGTLRIREELGRANLPDAQYSRSDESSVRVVLRNDIERRSRIGEDQETTAHANLFRVMWQATNDSDRQSSPPSTREIRHAFVQSLQAHDYSVDSFSQGTALSNEHNVTPEDLRKSGLVTIHEAFDFRIQRFSFGTFISIDPTIRIRSLARLDHIQRVLPTLAVHPRRKAFLRAENEWLPCRILGSATEPDVSIELVSKSRERMEVSPVDVLPVLPLWAVTEVLRKAGINVDLHKVIKELSLTLSKNASRTRSRKTEEIAQRLSKTIFPLQVGGYEVTLEPSLLRLSGSGLSVRDDLTDVQPLFDKEKEGRAPRVINGLGSYGSYEKPDRELPLVLLCPRTEVEAMKRLANQLHRGSHKFRGFMKTFGLTFAEPMVAAVNSPEDYEDECRRLTELVPDDTFFLVYCPEQGYSRSDYGAPYYRVKYVLLTNGFASQMLDEETLADLTWKDFNLALGVFAKAGYVPWVLSEGVPGADLFVGLSYSSIPSADGSSRLVGYVNVFDKYGKWLYYKGNTRVIPFSQRDQLFAELLADVVADYAKRATVQRLHIHHGFRLRRDSLKQIARAIRNVEPGAEVSFVWLNKHTNLRLYDDSPTGDGSLRRGAYVPVSPNRFLLSTTGFNDFAPPRGTPVPLDVSVRREGSTAAMDLQLYAQHLLSLTRLNWGSTKDLCREPITLKFASDIAYLMNVFLTNFGEFKLHPRLERTPWFL